MSIQKWPGGIVTKTPPAPSGPYETSTAPGIWTLTQVADYIKQGLWPTAGVQAPDPYFEYVPMLLSGNGTNGAQNNTFLDSSTNNISMTRTGSTTQGSFSPYGSLWSNYFNGTDASITSPSSTALQFGTGDYTIEFWCFGKTNSGYLFDSRFTTGGICIIQDAVYTGTTSSYTSRGNVGIPDFTWTHVALVRSSGTTNIYKNGVSVLTFSDTGNYASTQMVIAYYSGTSTGQYYQGYISNFRMVKGTAVYTANFTPSTTPLTAVSGTSLLTCQSNRFIDNSSNNFALTVAGSLSVQRFSPFNPTAPYSTTTIGGSGYFNGTSDYLNTATSSALDLDGTNYTIEGWVYLDGSKSTCTFAFADPYYVLGISVNRTGAGDTYVYTGNGSTWNGAPALISSSNLRLRCWNHVAFVQSNSQIALFHNGVQVAATSNGGLFPSGFNGKFYFGAVNDATEKFAGYMSDVRITRSALYTTTFTPPTAPLTQSGSLLLNYTNGAIFDSAMMNDLVTVGNAQISTSVVKYGTGSMYFSSSTSQLIVPSAVATNLMMGAGSFTAEAWVYPTNKTDGWIFGANGVGANVEYGLLWASGVLYARYGDNQSFTVTDTTTLNAWNHMAFVRNGSTITVYINGTSQGSATYSGSMGSVVPFTAGLGVHSLFQLQFQGYIDELRITKGLARYYSSATPSNTTASSIRSDATIAGFFGSGATYGIFNDYTAGQYLLVDFGASISVTSTTYQNAVGGQWAPTSVLIQSSNDGTTWTTRATYSDDNSSNLQTISSTGSGRYWRIYQNSNTRGNTAGYEWHMQNFTMTTTGPFTPPTQAFPNY